MREEPVITDGDAKPRQQPHRHEQDELGNAEWVHGEEPEGHGGADDRENIEQQEMAALQAVEVGVTDCLLAMVGSFARGPGHRNLCCGLKIGHSWTPFS